jgi:hypothetical protein
MSEFGIAGKNFFGPNSRQFLAALLQYPRAQIHSLQPSFLLLCHVIKNAAFVLSCSITVSPI